MGKKKKKSNNKKGIQLNNAPKPKKAPAKEAGDVGLFVIEPVSVKGKHAADAIRDTALGFSAEADEDFFVMTVDGEEIESELTDLDEDIPEIESADGLDDTDAFDFEDVDEFVEEIEEAPEEVLGEELEGEIEEAIEEASVEIEEAVEEVPEEEETEEIYEEIEEEAEEISEDIEEAPEEAFEEEFEEEVEETSEKIEEAVEETSEELEEELSETPEDLPEEASGETSVDAEGTEEPEERELDPEDENLSPFDLSLKYFSAADTGAEPPVTEKKTSDVIRTVMLCVFAAVFVISSYSFLQSAYQKYKSDKIYEKLQSEFGTGEEVEKEAGTFDMLEADSKSPATPTFDELLEGGVIEEEKKDNFDLEKMRASLTSLGNINPDIYGWIKIPGTTVNYPIAQAENNEYYLDHAYTGDNLTNGSIFADFRCDEYIPNNRNTVLYGHNITTGTMFHAVEDFFNRDLFDKGLIYLYTFDGVFIYKPFSVHETAYDSSFIDTYFETDEDFAAFQNKLAGESDLKADGVTLDGKSPIITLSTCTSSVRSTRRFALHAVLIDSVTDAK